MITAYADLAQPPPGGLRATRSSPMWSVKGSAVQLRTTDVPPAPGAEVPAAAGDPARLRLLSGSGTRLS